MQMEIKYIFIVNLSITPLGAIQVVIHTGGLGSLPLPSPYGLCYFDEVI